MTDPQIGFQPMAATSHQHFEIPFFFVDLDHLFSTFETRLGHPRILNFKKFLSLHIPEQSLPGEARTTSHILKNFRLRAAKRIDIAVPRALIEGKGGGCEYSYFRVMPD